MAPIGGHRVKRNTVSLLASCPVLTCRTVSLEQLVQQPGVGLDRANPVARHGDHLALQDTCTQLHFVGLDAMRSGEPPKDAEPDGHPSAATDHIGLPVADPSTTAPISNGSCRSTHVRVH